MLEGIVEERVEYNFETSASGSKIILLKRQRIIAIESKSQESLEDLDEWCDVTEELDTLDIR